jgi:hypothetical protein
MTKRDKKDANYRKARYQFKTFFWSLNTKTTVQYNSNFENGLDTKICHKKTEN